MASHMEVSKLETFLVHILTPVYRIAEDDTIRDAQMGMAYPTFHEIRKTDAFVIR